MFVPSVGAGLVREEAGLSSCESVDYAQRLVFTLLCTRFGFLHCSRKRLEPADRLWTSAGCGEEENERSMPGGPMPVRALALSPRHFDPTDKPEFPCSPRTNATSALLALCGQLESSSPRFSPSSPRSSPRFQSPRLSPADADAAFEEERRVARVHLEGSFARFYNDVDRPGAAAPATAEWKRAVLDMEEAAWAGCGGAIEQYWLLLRQAVSIAVAEHCSPNVGRIAEGRAASASGDQRSGRGTALKQSSPSAVQKLSDATPARTAKRRKSAQTPGGGRKSGASGVVAHSAAGAGISPKAASIPWTDEEDQRLKELVASTGTKWTIIGNRLKRTGKQCRERWCNHVDPSVSHAPWSDEEDRILIEAQKSLGNQWVEIAKLLPGRPYNAVKNRYNKASLRHKFGRGGTAAQIPASNKRAAGSSPTAAD